MPNWVKNKVEVTGKENDLIQFRKTHFNKEDEFDFNTIVQMPDNIFKGNLGMEEREKYGKDNWYDWSIANWGTKWNASETIAYQVKPDSFEFDFDTAWCCPEQIYEKLAQMYPNLHINVEFADEDIGNNCGIVTLFDGQTSVEYINDDDFAKKVWGIEEEFDEEE